VASTAWVLAVALLLPQLANAQLAVNETGSSWNDQTLKTATIKVTGATPGNIVYVIINAPGGGAKVQLRTAVADNNGEVTINLNTIPPPLSPPGTPTQDLAAGDQICVGERPPGKVQSVAKARGQLQVNGGVQNLGACPEPNMGPNLRVMAQQATDCELCDAALAFTVPGLTPVGTTALVLLLVVTGAFSLRQFRRHQATEA